MIRIAVVEDELCFIEELKGFFQQYQTETGEELEVAVFRDGDEILKNYRPCYDIIFMDIQMTFVDGMTAAEEIRAQDAQVQILFITNLPQYAIRGYEVGALDYVLKPLSYFVFSQKLARAIGRVRRRPEQFVTVAVKGGLQRLEPADILYIESAGHNLVYHTVEKTLSGPGSMKAAEEEFLPKHFARINKGCLVNLARATGIKDGCVLLGSEKLPISRGRKDAFMRELTIYWNEVR